MKYSQAILVAVVGGAALVSAAPAASSASTSTSTSVSATPTTTPGAEKAATAEQNPGAVPTPEVKTPTKPPHHHKKKGPHHHKPKHTETGAALRGEKSHAKAPSTKEQVPLKAEVAPLVAARDAELEEFWARAEELPAAAAPDATAASPAPAGPAPGEHKHKKEKGKGKRRHHHKKPPTEQQQVARDLFDDDLDLRSLLDLFRKGATKDGAKKDVHDHGVHKHGHHQHQTPALAAAAEHVPTPSANKAVPEAPAVNPGPGAPDASAQAALASRGVRDFLHAAKKTIFGGHKKQQAVDAGLQYAGSQDPTQYQGRALIDEEDLFEREFPEEDLFEREFVDEDLYGREFFEADLYGRDFVEEDLLEREFVEEDLMAREFEDDFLAAREYDIEDELLARDLLDSLRVVRNTIEAVSTRDIYDDFEARSFADWELEELD